MSQKVRCHRQIHHAVVPDRILHESRKIIVISKSLQEVSRIPKNIDISIIVKQVDTISNYIHKVGLVLQIHQTATGP